MVSLKFWTFHVSPQKVNLDKPHYFQHRLTRIMQLHRETTRTSSKRCSLFPLLSVSQKRRFPKIERDISAAASPLQV